MITGLLATSVFAENAVAQQSENHRLQIRGADATIVQAHMQGPQIIYPEVFMGVEDYHSPRIHRLREMYDFTDMIKDEESEFRKQLLLRQWVHNQWPIDNDQTFSGDAFAILHHARTSGEGFHCTHAMIVQQAVMTSSGYVVRNLGVDVDHSEFGRSYHHGVNEIWSNEFAKWVMLDAKYNNHFERNGIPLSASEIHEALRKGEREQIQMVIGPDRKPVPHPQREIYGNGQRVDTYWWVSYHLKQENFTQPHLAGGSKLVVWDNDAFRTDTWYRSSGSGLMPNWAYAANAFIPVEREQIEWTPGVTTLSNIRQAEPGRLHVRPRSATPNLKDYVYRINDGMWYSIKGNEIINWKLSAGENVLEIKSRNFFGVKGPAARAVVNTNRGHAITLESGLHQSGQDTLHLQSDELSLVVVNNEAYGELHRAGYSGIAELFLKDDDRNFFRITGTGLNFEFLFSGDSLSYDWNIFEPRRSPMELVRLSPDKVQLRQTRTENWPLQSSITYELSGNLIEMTYEGVPFEDAWSKHNYIGLFFASYINEPEEKGIHFIGKNRSEEVSEARWIYHLPPKHGTEANHRPAGSNWDPPFDEGFPLSLVSGISDYEYIYPFYYGRSGDDVLIMMFERPDDEDEMRFAQSPDALSRPNTNPAWDFVYFKKNPAIGEVFSFRVGMIVKKFEGIGDIIEQYERWSGDSVEANGKWKME